MEMQAYLDNSATTRQLDEVTNEMQMVNDTIFGNPSSLHHMGYEAEKVLTAGRQAVCNVLDAKLKEVYFTSSGTEANNLAIRGFLEGNPRRGKHIIVSAIEHASVYELVKYLSKNTYTVDFAPVDNKGVVDLDKLEKLMKPEIALISIMHVNNETGSIQSLKEIDLLRKQKAVNAVFHCDGVQAFGKIPFNPAYAGVDLYTASAHKIHGPKGVGLLYIKEGVRLMPLIFGGGQEGGLRSGTENIPGIAGFRVAIENTGDVGENYAHVKSLWDRMYGEITRLLPEAIILTDAKASSPYILTVAFPGLRAEVLQHTLESRGIYVSVGSACSSHKKDRSHVLTAMGYKTNVIDGAIRISFSRLNNCNEIDYAAGVLAEEVTVLANRRK